MGCIPSILSQSTTSQCSEEVNQLVLPFNANTKTMINNLNTTLPGARITFIDIHNMIQDILANPGSYGFSVLDRWCCGIGKNNRQITCLPMQQPCSNRECTNGEEGLHWKSRCCFSHRHPAACQSLILYVIWRQQGYRAMRGLLFL